MKTKRASERMQYQAKPRCKTVLFTPAVRDFGDCLEKKVKKRSICGETKAKVRKEEKRRYDDAERSQNSFALAVSICRLIFFRTNCRNDFCRCERQSDNCRIFCIHIGSTRVCLCSRSSSFFRRFLLQNLGLCVYLKSETSGLRIFASACICRLFVPTYISIIR
jgi:hypothetical protein